MLGLAANVLIRLIAAIALTEYIAEPFMPHVAYTLYSGGTEGLDGVHQAASNDLLHSVCETFDMLVLI